MIIIFAVVTPTESQTEGQTEIRMLGPGLRTANGHTETRTVSRTVRWTVLPCEQGIRNCESETVTQLCGSLGVLAIHVLRLCQLLTCSCNN
jgi:hypothetical protein